MVLLTRAVRLRLAVLLTRTVLHQQVIRAVRYHAVTQAVRHQQVTRAVLLLPVKAVTRPVAKAAMKTHAKSQS